MLQLLYFVSPTCGPCRNLSPAVDHFEQVNPRAISVMRVNTNDPRGLAFARQHHVQTTPTLILMMDGHEVSRANQMAPYAESIQNWTDQF